MNEALKQQIEALGYITHVQHGAHAAVALRYRRAEPGGTWGVLVWQAGQLVFSWAVTRDGFRETGVQALLPLLAGPEAVAEYAAKRKAANDKAAATQWLTGILEPLITPVLRERLALEDFPREWLAGGLVCDGKRIASFVKKIEKGEASADGRDRAGG